MDHESRLSFQSTAFQAKNEMKSLISFAILTWEKIIKIRPQSSTLHKHSHCLFLLLRRTCFHLLLCCANFATTLSDDCDDRYSTNILWLPNSITFLYSLHSRHSWLILTGNAEVKLNTPMIALLKWMLKCKAAVHAFKHSDPCLVSQNVCLWKRCIFSPGQGLALSFGMTDPVMRTIKG